MRPNGGLAVTLGRHSWSNSVEGNVSSTRSWVIVILGIWVCRASFVPPLPVIKVDPFLRRGRQLREKLTLGRDPVGSTRSGGRDHINGLGPGVSPPCSLCGKLASRVEDQQVSLP